MEERRNVQQRAMVGRAGEGRSPPNKSKRSVIMVKRINKSVKAFASLRNI